MEFSLSNFTIQTFTSHKFFENLYNLINIKINLHHSHTACKNFGYSHDFCNWKVRGNENGFSCIARIFLDLTFTF